ncbi:hypothetical protein JRI60_26455 [Archangium violaceum]|uniref:hypothetical protein n=1 Tax=Archangium violaceum TaxID=83451 RepID=UPI001951DBCF|nr:hypothetical protein [Archangium violaceum]QRO02300.1 hypothetical protein JRI60_26455 [Archangium violaceum]
MMALVVSLVLSSSPVLEPAREAYQAGEMTKARAELEALLYPLRLNDTAEEAEAHLLLAATFHAQEDPERAEREVIQGLAASPGVKLDPLLYPPDFIAFVERVRGLHSASISELAERRRRPVLEPPARPQPSEVELALQPRRQPPSRGWYLVPFGVGHFVHQRETKGTVLAVTQGTSFVVSAVSLGTALALRGPDGKYTPEDASTARGLNVSYLVGAYAFAALYAYGVLDGLVFTPEEQVLRGAQDGN